MSTDSYIPMENLWHDLPDPEGHLGVKKPKGAVYMSEFFKKPSMYPSTNGKISGNLWTPFCSGAGNAPPTIIAPWGEVPDGVSVPYDYKDEPEKFVPNDKHTGHLLQMRFSGDALLIVRNFMAMLKQYLTDNFPRMAPRKVLDKYPTADMQKAYIDEFWVGWAGTYEDKDGNVRDAYGKVKTRQVLRDQSKRRHKQSLTEFIRAREVTNADGSVSIHTDNEPIDLSVINRGSRVKPMMNLDWVSFSEGKKPADREIYISFTANAVLVDPFVEVASASNPSTLAKLGMVTTASIDHPTGPDGMETKDDTTSVAPGPAAEHSNVALPMAPSAEEGPKARKRGPPADDDGTGKRSRSDSVSAN